MRACVETAAAGRSELDVLTALSVSLNALGSEHPAVPHVVLAGARSVHGHQLASQQVIRNPDSLVRCS
jgi:hypothetical protein